MNKLNKDLPAVDSKMQTLTFTGTSTSKLGDDSKDKNERRKIQLGGSSHSKPPETPSMVVDGVSM